MGQIEVRTTANGQRHYKARYRDGEGVRHSQTFKTKREAQQWLAKQRVTEDEGRFVAPRSGLMRVRDLYEKHYTDLDLKASSAFTAKNRIEVHILPEFGDSSLREVTRPRVQAWVLDKAKVRSAATTRHALIQLNKLMQLAVELDLIPTNPCTGVRVPRLPAPPFRVLAPDEIARLAEAAGSHKAMILVLAYGGLRLGETIALRRSDLSEDCRVIRVTRSIASVGGRLVEGTPKSRSAIRSVTLPRFVSEELDQLVKRNPTDVVFSAPRGGHLNPSTWRNRVFVPACREAGITNLRIHDLRHTAVSLWIAAGATPKEVSARAGHASASFTLDRYGHLFPGDDERLADRLDALNEPRTSSG